MDGSANVPLDVWTLGGVAGVLTFAFYGEVVMLHTSDQDQGVVYVDDLMTRTCPGRPTEMTPEQAIGLAEHILRVLAPDRLRPQVISPVQNRIPGNRGVIG